MKIRQVQCEAQKKKMKLNWKMEIKSKTKQIN